MQRISVAFHQTKKDVPPVQAMEFRQPDFAPQGNSDALEYMGNAVFSEGIDEVVEGYYAEKHKDAESCS